MKFPRVRVRRCLLVLMLTPPLVWALVLIVTPTEWARARIVAHMRQATGRSIRLASLKIGALGGILLSDLEIGAPGGQRDPWLTIRSARIDVSLLQLLAGQIEPTYAHVDGLTLRIQRRQDGRLELADLLPRSPNEASAPDEAPQCRGPTEMVLKLENARITIDDEPSRTRFELTEVSGHGTCHGRRVSLPELRGKLNGGTFELAVSIDRTGSEPAFETRLRARSVALSADTELVSYVVPVLSPTSAADPTPVSLDLDLYLLGHGRTRAAFGQSLVGQGSLKIDPASLNAEELLARLDPLYDFPGNARVSVVKTDFAIRDRRVRSDNLTLVVEQIPIVLTGWTDFDGQVDYRVRTESLTRRRLSKNTRDFLADFSINVQQPAELRVSGTTEAMRVTLDGRPLQPVAGDNGDDRRDGDGQRLREIGQRVRDRILR